jgi:hypothetical protein
MFRNEQTMAGGTFKPTAIYDRSQPMKLAAKILCAILIVSVVPGSLWAAVDSKVATVTLLPVAENTMEDQPEGARDLLWLQTADDKKINLSFDLSRLPADLKEQDFKKCTLRLVAQNILFQPKDYAKVTGGPRIRIKGQPANSEGDFIVTLSVLSQKNQPVTLNQETSDAFRRAIYSAYASREKKIALSLTTDSKRAGGLFYSSKNFGDSPSQIPRLVISYQHRSATLYDSLSWSQHQHNPEHTGSNAWVPFKNPAKYRLDKISIASGTIAGYPLIHRGDLYFINTINNENFLVASDFKGMEKWRQSLGAGTVQRAPVISREGTMYVVTEKNITSYDLSRSGAQLAAFPLPGKLSDYTELTVGHDGSLFLALKQSDVNYLYAFTQDLQPFIQSRPFGKGNVDNISSITVSADGEEIFAQVPNGAVVIDIADPEQQRIIKLENDKLKPFMHYHTPVASAEGGIMIYSDFDSNRGNVWAYTLSKRIWNFPEKDQDMTDIPQPVLGSNDMVYFIQNSSLQRHKMNAKGSGERLAGKDLAATSNLLMDAANNIYFWDKGHLRGYNKDGALLFEQDFTNQGPQQFIRLTLAPDGTLWTNNKNGISLFAFKPLYADPDLSVNQDDIKNRTCYRANRTLSVNAVTIDNTTQVVFQAQHAIKFSRGFKVQKGGSIVVRTGD